MGHPIKPIGPAVEPILERLRAICLSFPDTEERLAWGEPTWRVRGRMFAMFDNNHHNAGHIAVWVNAAPGAQEVLANANPDLFFIPPYQGKAGWIGILLDREPDWDEVAGVIADGYTVSAEKAPVKGTRRKSVPK